MKILWFSWKDIRNPLAGGAEVVTDQLLKRFTADGNEAILITAGYNGASPIDKINGYKVIRVGGRWSVYWNAYKYYKQNLKGWADVVVEEINTIPFFTQSYIKKEKRFLFFHQLCRQIWFYQMFFPLNIVGYLSEPIYLFLLRKNKVITISDSTKKDLSHFGFNQKDIRIISEGIEIKPVGDLSKIKKYPEFTILSFGAIRDMKRPIDQVKAFEIAKKEIPQLKMKIAGGGSGKYFEKMMTLIKNSPYKDDIDYLGRVSQEQKIELMQNCHLITVTSVKEGWGLIVSEANSQGTPAVVYNVDGLRDSVKNNETGLVINKNTPQNLSNGIIEILKNEKKYSTLSQNALNFSKKLTFEQAHKDFIQVIGQNRE